jgi:nuclear pore complex protein Nup98-Nup96
MSKERQDQLNASFSSQLESLGLWHWSVFVLLHIDDDGERRRKVGEVLARHVRLGDEDSSERESFIIEQLRVPVSWIAEAKATRAGSERNYKDEAWYLIKAAKFNRAHRVVVKKIAPDAVVDDDYEFLHALLAELDRASDDVSGWELGGRYTYHIYI